MASTPESKVKTKVKALLTKEGVYHFSPATWGMGRAGVPDIICCASGFFLAIECKAGKGKTTALQDAEIANIRQAGGRALVIREDGMDVLSAAIAVLRAMALRPHADSSLIPWR